MKNAVMLGGDACNHIGNVMMWSGDATITWAILLYGVMMPLIMWECCNVEW